MIMFKDIIETTHSAIEDGHTIDTIVLTDDAQAKIISDANFADRIMGDDDGDSDAELTANGWSIVSGNENMVVTDAGRNYKI